MAVIPPGRQALTRSSQMACSLHPASGVARDTACWEGDVIPLLHVVATTLSV